MEAQRFGVPSGLGDRLGQLISLPTAVAQGDGELPHPPVSTATRNSWRREEGAALAGAHCRRVGAGAGSSSTSRGPQQCLGTVSR